MGSNGLTFSSLICLLAILRCSGRYLGSSRTHHEVAAGITANDDVAVSLERPTEKREERAALLLQAVSGHAAVKRSDAVGEHQEEASFFDWFFVIYWGSCAAVFAIVVALLASWRTCIRERKEAKGEIEEESDEMAENVLSENMWALNLIASLGKVKFGNGELVPAWLVATISFSMGLLQLAAIYLMVTAINPHAHPVTETPGAPWLRDTSPVPINCMKWFMVTFLTIGQVGEVAQCRRLVTETLLVNQKQLLVSRWLTLAAAMVQYSVSVSVVWAGVSVILCFQTVPDIVYSSMSVFFITTADEMFFECFQTICDLEAVWDIADTADEGSRTPPVHGHTFGDMVGFGGHAGGHSNTMPDPFRQTASAPDALRPMNSFAAAAAEGRAKSWGLARGYHINETGEVLHHCFGERMHTLKHVPLKVWWSLKILQLFPMVFGFFVLSRAFYTNVMPTARIHVLGIS